MSMSRRQIREEIFKLLFRAEFHSREELSGQLELGLAHPDEAYDTDESGEVTAPDEAVVAYIRVKFNDICSHLDEIDALINENASGWKTTRMAKAELAIIRLAVYEMKYEEDMPVSVAINEAVELAKIYGSDKGSAFVNGVLAKLA